MKRILSLALALLMILACTPVVMAESEFEYVDYEGGIAIVGYNGPRGVVTIPAEIDGKKVVATKSTTGKDIYNTFGGRNDITKVILPEGLKVIGYDSFYQMTNLKEVVLPNTLEKIASGAFGGSGITSISIPESVTMIEGGAFSNTKLASIHIPKKANLGGSIVSSCKLLKNITVDSANPYYAADGKYLYSKDNGTGVDYAGGLTDKRITVPSYIKNIMHYCFINNQHIETVIIHENLIKVYYFAFQGCSNLKEIYVKGKDTLVSNNIAMDNPNLIVYTNGKIDDYADGPKDTSDEFIVKPYIEGMENPTTTTTTEKAKETTTKPSASKTEKPVVKDDVTESTTETTVITTESTTLEKTETNENVGKESVETIGAIENENENKSTPIVIGVIAVVAVGAVATGVTITLKKKKK